jgi:protein-disulfide isomerase
MSEPNNKFPIILVALVILAALAGAVLYFSGANKESALPQGTEQQAASPAQEEPIVEGEVPPQPETPQNSAVAESATPDVPTAEEASQSEATATAPSNSSVDAMMADRSLGDPNAPIKVTEYSSLTCSHCASFHNEDFAKFKEKFIDTGRVQMTFKEFPLNQPALDASQILRCMPADKFVNFMNLLFAQQESWAYTPEYKNFLRQNAKLAGMSDEQFDACLANTELKNRIAADMKAASDKFKIQSTPSFIINNGQKVIVGHHSLDVFEKSFDEVTNPAAPAPAQ